MCIVVDNFDSPRHGVSSDGEYMFVFHALHQRAKLFRPPWFNLCLAPFSTQWQIMSVYINTHPLHGIPSPEGHDFPLVIVRSTNNRPRKRTHQPVSLLNVLGRTTTHLPRVFLDIEVGPRVKILDLVDSWLQSSVFEDGRGAGMQVRSHS